MPTTMRTKKGIKTPKQDIDLIKKRLQAAEQHHRANYGGDRKK